MNLIFRIQMNLVYGVHRFLVRLKLPVCEGFEGPCFRIGERRRLNTAFIDDKQNYSVQCRDCFHGLCAYYADLRNEYRGGQLL